MTLILGINAFHADSAAAIVRNGVIISAAEEERFRRIKHWAGFPSKAIEWCLRDANASLTDLDHIAINTLPSANRLRKIFYTILNRPNPHFIVARWKNKMQRAGIAEQLAHSFPNQKVRGSYHFIEHHLAHLASAFFASPYEESAVVSVDGFGDFASGAWGHGQGTKINVKGQIYFPHSLGAFYTAMTQYLGFPSYGDEYKVMGLAPYGKPNQIELMRQVVNINKDGTYRLNLKYFRHASHNLPHQWSHGIPVVGEHYSPELEGLLGPARKANEPLDQRHIDIARSTQTMYEEALFNLLNAIHRRSPSDNLCIAGGCGANSVANGKISSATPFKQLYVQAAAGDAGGALGAALQVWNQFYNERSKPMLNAYLGTEADTDEIKSLLNSRDSIDALSKNNCTINIYIDPKICNKVAEAISQGKVVGWFDGRMEWGPRALGHRSILGDPRRADMKEILNKKIKRRESFRPFAPSILREYVSQWFEIDHDVPFMMQVLPIRKEKRILIPAVTHVDGSGRLQTVTEKENGRYYQLICSFERLTGIPMILNTSFNENEPIVCTPSQALDCFLRTKMDILVLANYFIMRTP